MSFKINDVLKEKMGMVEYVNDSYFIVLLWYKVYKGNMFDINIMYGIESWFSWEKKEFYILCFMF